MQPLQSAATTELQEDKFCAPGHANYQEFDMPAKPRRSDATQRWPRTAVVPATLLVSLVAAFVLMPRAAAAELCESPVLLQRHVIWSQSDTLVGDDIDTSLPDLDKTLAASALGASDEPPPRKTLGIKWNSSGDTAALIHGLVFCLGGSFLALAFFSVVRCRYPLVYANNVLEDAAPFEPDPSFFGWVSASLGLTLDQVETCAGLDAAMFLEFDHLCMKVLAVVSLSSSFVFVPLHFIYAKISTSEDFLVRVGMSGISKEMEAKWICWVHAGAVWFVIAVVQWFIFGAQEGFIRRRMAWLHRMSSPRATTILVKSIPQEQRSDSKLAAYFDGLFGSREVVSSAYVVRRTEKLLAMQQKLKEASGNLEGAEFQWEKAGRDASERPTHAGPSGDRVDSILHHQEAKQTLQSAVREEQARIERAAAEGDEGVSGRHGFVTFRDRRDAEMALQMRITPNEKEFVLSLPPDPSDVIWRDLLQDPTQLLVREGFGYCCITLLFFGFFPLVICVCSLASLETLQDRVPLFKTIVEHHPSLHASWDGLVGSMLLSALMGFVPTCLAWVFRHFYVLEAEAWGQQLLQRWYFDFLVVFLLFVTCISNSLLETVETLVSNPMSIFPLLATSLPKATNFYLKYFLVQWMVHCTNLTRYANFGQFLLWRTVCEDSRARELSEPEDQDYSGMGARSARHTLLFIMALVFCNICPLICPLALVNFGISRVLYGYLLVFAETQKPDLGGIFWTQQIGQVQKGLAIYVTFMVGALVQRSGSYGPCMLAAGGYLLLAICDMRLRSTFRWEKLSLNELSSCDSCDAYTTSSALRRTSQSTRKDYVQPELVRGQ